MEGEIGNSNTFTNAILVSIIGILYIAIDNCIKNSTVHSNCVYSETTTTCVPNYCDITL